MLAKYGQDLDRAFWKAHPGLTYYRGVPGGGQFVSGALLAVAGGVGIATGVGLLCQVADRRTVSTKNGRTELAKHLFTCKQMGHLTEAIAYRGLFPVVKTKPNEKNESSSCPALHLRIALLAQEEENGPQKTRLLTLYKIVKVYEEFCLPYLGIYNEFCEARRNINEQYNRCKIMAENEATHYQRIQIDMAPSEGQVGFTAEQLIEMDERMQSIRENRPKVLKDLEAWKDRFLKDLNAEYELKVQTYTADNAIITKFFEEVLIAQSVTEGTLGTLVTKRL